MLQSLHGCAVTCGSSGNVHTQSPRGCHSRGTATGACSCSSLSTRSNPRLIRRSLRCMMLITGLMTALPRDCVIVSVDEYEFDDERDGGLDNEKGFEKGDISLLCDVWNVESIVFKSRLQFADALLESSFWPIRLGFDDAPSTVGGEASESATLGVTELPKRDAKACRGMQRFQDFARKYQWALTWSAHMQLQRSYKRTQACVSAHASIVQQLSPINSTLSSLSAMWLGITMI